MPQSQSQAQTEIEALSVVIPVYNSRQTLEQLADRLGRVLPELCREFEVVLVNDGSQDGSWQEIERLAKDRPWLKGLDLMRNYGQHNALLCGIRAAVFPVIVTLDDDLQHPPEEIGKLLDKLVPGVDVVYGVPASETHTFWRNIASQVTKLAMKSAMGVDVARNVSAFRAFRTELRQAADDFQSPFVSIDVLLTWATTSFEAVSVRHEPRQTGQSNYSFRSLLAHAFNMMTGFSTLPLQLASWTGFFCILFGIGLLLYVIGRFFFWGVTVPGFTFLASTIAIFAGAQLFALGIIGEYLARMHFRIMDRPVYTIRRQAQMRPPGEDEGLSQN